MRSVLNQSAQSSDYLTDTTEISDRELFNRIASGDEQALAELYARYRSDIYRFALHQIQDVPAAEEILQDVFVAAWRRAADFRGSASVKTWLLRVTYYRSATWLSRLKKPLTLDEIDQLPSTRPGPDELAANRWQSAQLQEAILQLTPKHRAAVELIFYHELTYREAAEVVGCPVGTMKSRVNYALNQISALLLRAGLEET